MIATNAVESVNKQKAKIDPKIISLSSLASYVRNSFRTSAISETFCVIPYMNHVIGRFMYLDKGNCKSKTLTIKFLVAWWGSYYKNI